MNRNRRFEALINYYVLSRPVGQVVSELSDIMEKLDDREKKAAEWTINAFKETADDVRLREMDSIAASREIASTAAAYFERQGLKPSEEVLLDIVQAVVLNLACMVYEREAPPATPASKKRLWQFWR